MADGTEAEERTEGAGLPAAETQPQAAGGDAFARAMALDLSGKTERLAKRNRQTGRTAYLRYLSWANAWAAFKGVYPDGTYRVERRADGMPYFEDRRGCMVFTEVTANGETHSMWLPVMDSRGDVIAEPTLSDINKSLMRCLTKNIAMFGVGLSVYAGEDVPERDIEPPARPRTESAGSFAALTESEIAGRYGVADAAKAAGWLESRYGAPLSSLTREQTEEARELLGRRASRRAAKAQGAEAGKG